MAEYWFYTHTGANYHTFPASTSNIPSVRKALHQLLLQAFAVPWIFDTMTIIKAGSALNRKTHYSENGQQVTPKRS
jgi:hypothetical protein